MSKQQLLHNLQSIFPASVYPVDQAVEDVFRADEKVIWIGGPERWGLFSLTPFLYAIAGAVVALWLFALQSGGSESFYSLSRSLFSGNDTFAILLPVALWVGLLLYAMRDPRRRWRFVVTDQRLLVMYRGKKLREAGPDDFDNLGVLDGPERRLRNLGHIVWRVHVRTDSSAGGGGPDQGQHGFRGLRNPQQWRQRLLAWRAALHQQAATSSQEDNSDN